MKMGVTRLIIASAWGLFVFRIIISAELCKLYSLPLPYTRRYCPGDGRIIPRLLPHQCRYTCLLSPTCKAYNYNATEKVCTHLTSPCPLAFSDTAMEYAVFREKSIDQCYQWESNSSEDVSRMITTDIPTSFICRMQRNDSDILCRFHAMRTKCYAIWENSTFENNDGYPCQRLRIMEGCTVFWVPYTAGDPINPTAVIGGHMANGSVVYVTKFDYYNPNRPSVKSLVGHYVEGAAFTIGRLRGTTRRSSTMMMLVVL